MQMGDQQWALMLKEEGNKHFSDKEYDQAIQKYSEAIGKYPKMSILYSNRARCYKNIEQYEKSYKDAEESIRLDDKNIKAYFLMGESLVALAQTSKDSKKIEIAIEKLRKSRSLCPSQGKNQFEERFTHEIYRAKKKLWLIQAENQKDKRKAFRSYLINLIESDSTLDEDKKERLEKEVVESYNSNSIADKSLIPKALICPLSKAIMINPLCNQFGNSYSKKQYKEHIRDKKIDPLSKKPLKSPDLVYNNLNLKNAIESYLQKFPWAYEEVL